MHGEIIGCHTLICGATSLALGLATMLDTDTLIVEKGITPASEFISSFRPGEQWDRDFQHPSTLIWRNRLQEHNLLIDNGQIHLPPLHPLFCKHIHQQHIRILFLSSIVEVIPTNSGYEVVLITHAGLRQVRTKQIIDTTSIRLSFPKAPVPIIEKSINALLHSENIPDIFESLYAYGHGSIQTGRFPTEAYLRLPVAKSATWADAREELYQYWSVRPPEWLHWTIAAVADEFDIRVPGGPHVVQKDWIWLPSSAYPNVLAAYEAGLCYLQTAEV